MKITKFQLKQIIEEELSNISEGGFAGHQEEDAPRSLLLTVLTARMQEEKDRLQRALPTSNVSNSEWRSAVDMARDVVFPEVEPEPQSTSWLDAPPTSPPSQEPFSVTDPGERPTLQEQIKKILSEA
jgi:hypothetical protein